MLDLDELARQDTFVYTGAYTRGVPHVTVNGQVVVQHGEHLGTRAGLHLPRR